MGKLQNHFISATAINAAASPAYAMLEKYVSKMSNEVSISARAWAAGITYAGSSYLWLWGRQKWMDRFGVSDDSSRKKWHDFAYSSVFNALFAPALYVASGSRDLEEILWGTGTAVLTSGPIGMACGYAADAFGELTDTVPSTRVPEAVRNAPTYVKRGLAVGACALSLASMVALYKLAPEAQRVTQAPITVHAESGETASR